MKELVVKSKKPYSVIISGDSSLFADFALKQIKGNKVAIITDETVDKLYPEELKTLANKQVFKYVIPAGENQKNVENFSLLLNRLAKDGFTREDAIVTFGGGVVGDLGGFVASCYMRGITLIALPTTLLAMVDSSVGGKTAINIERGKNLCGVFYQPSLVYVNTGYLKTLDRANVLCGLGEVLKYSFIGAEDFGNYIIDENLIYNCLKIKAEIVGEDEFESGKRKLLNFGHTFGHAIERLSGLKISHGLCVAKGILFALILSKNYFNYGDAFINEYKEQTKRLGIDLDTPYSVSSLVQAIYDDKKRKADKIDFVLIDENKKARIVPIALKEVQALI